MACIWLWAREDRTPTLRLQANTHYWDSSRGPRLSEVVFCNDLDPKDALDRVCSTEGEVDIVTEVRPADASRVEGSEHARLVSIDAVRSVVGIINHDADGLPLADKRARLALNHAVDRPGLVRGALRGFGKPLAGLAPPSAVPRLLRLTPYPHDPGRAAKLWREVAGSTTRPIRLAAPEALEPAAGHLAANLRAALQVAIEVTILRGSEVMDARRNLAERRPRGWDILLYEQSAQAVDSVTLEFHRAFVGESGEYRAGPVVPEFEELYGEFARAIDPHRQAHLARRIDRLVRDEALTLPLYAPEVLYAVNRHVHFTPYRTSFELAETWVDSGHWSRR